MTDPDPLVEQLADLDPVCVNPAPDVGSARHAEILERAMHPRTTANDHRPITVRGRRPLVLALAATLVILAVVAGFVAIRPDGRLSPAAALTQAVDNTDEALTLRSEYRRDDGEGGLSVIRSEHRGRDLRRTFSSIGPDGAERPAGEGDEVVVYIGDTGWTADAPDAPQPVAPEQRNAPYATSSAAIVEAAMTAETITERGVEDVRGTEATHYEIRLDDAAIARLAALPANQMSGFELESPSNVRSLDVWVADGYIRRIRVVQDWEAADSPGTTVEFYDFGADITITPPA